MKLWVKHLCDGCPETFTLDPEESPLWIPFGGNRFFSGDQRHLQAFMVILGVDSLEFCSEECRDRLAKAISGNLLFALQDSAGELLRSVGIEAKAEADKAAALQQPDSLVGSECPDATGPSAVDNVRTEPEEPCQRISRPEVLAARSDPPVAPLGDPAARPNQPEPADAELPF